MTTRGLPESVLLICLFMHRIKLDLFRQGFHVKYYYVMSIFSDLRLKIRIALLRQTKLHLRERIVCKHSIIYKTF